MSSTIGVDCHFTLQHPDIDAGAAYGFIVSAEDNDLAREGAQIIRSNVGGAWGISYYSWIKLKVIMQDNMINPDGSIHAETKAAMYAKLAQFMTKTGNITFTDSIGVTSDLSFFGYFSDERISPDKIIAKITLSNLNAYYPPVDPIALNASIWDGVLTWDTSYWRSV